MNFSKPFSQACENNKRPIQNVLDAYFKRGGNLLEIGSGTGQHGFYFTEQYQNLHWQPSDRSANLPGIEAWVNEASRSNFPSPITLDVDAPVIELDPVDFIYSANTAHIMPWQSVLNFFKLVPKLLKKGAYFFLYGPFKYEGQYTSDSNAQFDLWLKHHAAHQGIRDVEALFELATQNQLKLIADHAMPANNQCLIWQLEG